MVMHVYTRKLHREKEIRGSSMYMCMVYSEASFFQLYVYMSHTMSVQSPDPFPFLCLAPFLVHV